MSQGDLAAFLGHAEKAQKFGTAVSFVFGTGTTALLFHYSLLV